MHILINSAYPLSSPKGNSITAKRIAHLLTRAGMHAEAIHCDMPLPADAMIALHATKTLTASKRFKTHSPASLLIIYLTGTDLYRDLPAGNPEFFEALDLADLLVVSQRASLASIPAEYAHKAHYVPASVLLPEEEIVPAPAAPSIALVGHLRPVKNPFLLNQALQLLPDLELTAYSLGAALEPAMANQARDWQARDPRYHWLDHIPYPQTLSWIRQVNFTLNSSHSEGGSNAVAESIVLGTPVLASKIEGNVGLLGDDYLGYFQPNNAESLADLLRRALTDNHFHRTLQQQTHALQPHFSPAKETAGWLALLAFCK